MPKLTRYLAALLTLTGLAACGGPAAPASSGEASGQPAHVIMVSQTLNPPQLSNLYYWVAKNKGFFAKNGLDVEFQASGTNTTANAVVMNGTAQFASTSLTGVAAAVAAGSAAHIVVVGMWNFPYNIVAKDSIKSVADLKGKIVGISSLGEFTHLLAEAYVSSQGVDTKSIQWVSTGSAGNVAQFLITGKIDAAPLTTDQTLRAMKQNGGLHMLVGPEPIRAVYPVSGGVIEVSDSYIGQHPNLVEGFTRSVIEANRLMYQDESAYKEVANQILPNQYTDQDLDTIYQSFRPYFGINGGAQDKQFNAILKQVRGQDPKTAGRISSLDKVIDRRFIKNTLDQLSVAQGAEDDASWYKK